MGSSLGFCKTSDRRAIYRGNVNSPLGTQIKKFLEFPEKKQSFRTRKKWSNTAPPADTNFGFSNLEQKNTSIKSPPPVGQDLKVGFWNGVFPEIPEIRTFLEKIPDFL